MRPLNRTGQDMTQDMNRHFSMSALLKYTFPTICMMIFTSLYEVVDGFFVSNFVGKTALAAVNLAWPVVMILATIGLMTGTGGSALVAKTRGEGDDERANRYFSMLVIFTIGFAIILAVLGQWLIEPLIAAFGAQGELLDESVIYGRWTLLALPFFALQFAFQTFFSTAGKPNYGFFVIGYTAMIFGAIFMGYALGSSPLMSYQYGAKNHAEMRSILFKSLGFIGVGSVLMFLAAEWLAGPLSAIFVSYDPALLEFTTKAYRIYAFAFLIMGVPIYASALFTSLGNGIVSAVIAFLRTIVFECGAVLLLPLILGIDGIWLSVSVGELAAAVLATCFMIAFRNRYGYGKRGAARQ